MNTRYILTVVAYGVYATGTDEDTREIVELVLLGDGSEVQQIIPVHGGCYECNHAVQPGHFACSVSHPMLLALEESKQATRVLDNNTWRWYDVPEEWNKDLSQFSNNPNRIY